MNKSFPGLVLGLFLFSFSLVGQGAGYKGPELERLPKAVQKTIKKQLGNGKLACIEASVESGEMFYSIEMKKNGKDRSFVVEHDGTLNRIDVLLAETPAEVQAGIQAQLGNGVLVEIDKILGEDEPTYDIEMTKDGKDRSFSVDAQGTLYSTEVFLQEIPEDIRKVIQTRVGSGRLGDIYKLTEDGDITYDVGMTRHRKSMPFVVDSDGELVSAVILLEDAPEPVQKVIGEKTADAYLEKIERFIDAGKTTYEVTLTKDNETSVIELSASGKIIEKPDPDGLRKTSV